MKIRKGSENKCVGKDNIIFCVFSMLKDVLDIAETIASKSPVAIQGTKENLVYSRDHTVQEGLDHVVSPRYLNSNQSETSKEIKTNLTDGNRMALTSFVFQATWNRFMLQSEDLSTGVMAGLSKQKDVVFSKL